jgi:uncharacterized protein YkwD
MRNTGQFRLAAAFVCFALLFGGAAYAADEIGDAAAYLAERGIYEGDGNGNLSLDGSLTRAELAVILARLDYIANSDSPEAGLAEWRDWGETRFSDPENRYNKFSDIPDWALPYVEYCYVRGLVKGTTETSFEPRTAVSPKMACTVILRYRGVAETDWDYGTSVEKARGLGLLPDYGVDGETITRGTMAVVIRRGMGYEAVKAVPENATGSVPETPNAVATPQPDAPAASVAAMTIDEMKAEIVRLTNEERAKAGLPALEVLPELMDCAQAKAQDMAVTDYYDHYSPTYGDSGNMIRAFVNKPIRADGVVCLGENIDVSSPYFATPSHTFDGWMRSIGHRSHILRATFTHIGVGVYEDDDGGFYWVQQFVALA